MTSELDAVARIAFVLLATYFLHSTCLLGAVWIATRFFRLRNGLVVERLWKMAAIAGLITAPLQLAAGIHPVVDFAIGDTLAPTSNPTGGSVEPISQMQSRVTYRPATRSPMVERLSGKHERNSETMPVRQPREASKRRRHPSRRTDATSVEGKSTPAASVEWAAPRGFACALAACSVGLFGLARLALQSLRFRHRLRDCKPVNSGPLRGSLDELLQRAGIRRTVRLESTMQLDEPVACGVWRWRIVLPQAIGERLRDEELRALLAHEVAHLVRGDTTWLWIGRVLCGCFAFQPLNFIARGRWQRAAEFLCDDWALRHNADPLSLANCLTQMAEWRLDRRDLAGALAATGGSSAITERIERLINAAPKQVVPARTWTINLLVGCVAILMTVAGPRASWRFAAANENPMPANLSSVERAAVAEDLRQSLIELEHCQRRLAEATSPELREFASRLRRRGEVLRRYQDSLSFTVDVPESK
jgi:beta-lactamase regulating signal transducer with metallopeptidase domain